MKNNGISLISLIITVLIIAILAAVMIPSGIDKINNAKLTTFNDNILTLKQEANGYFMINDEYPAKTDTNGNHIVYSITNNPSLLSEITKKNDQTDTFYIIDLDKLKIDNKDNGVGKTIDDYYIIAKNSGNIYYAKGIKIGNLVYHTKQNKGDEVVAMVPTSAPLSAGIPNAPKLAAGMTPVKWNGTSWVKADMGNNNNDWYDYTKGINKWANVMLLDGCDGNTTFNGSMLVWIPRYTYKILSGEHTSTAGEISIHFSNGTTDDTSGGYRIHPAFYWGGWNIPQAPAPMTKQIGNGEKELTGIWVAKFEASPREGTSESEAGDNVITKHVKIVPNAKSWRYISVSNIYKVCKNMQDTADYITYGITNDRNIIDTHMMKNSEWAAVAYLSKYTLGTSEVAINTNSNYITASTDIVTNKAQSTTGTEYGIFDMNGGSYEYVASYIANNHDNLTTYASSLYTEIKQKYKDVFPIGASDSEEDNYAAASQAYGHSIYETSSGTGGELSWFGDCSYFPNKWHPIFLRSGVFHNGSSAGLFYCYYDDALPYDYTSFRPCVVVP